MSKQFVARCTISWIYSF